MPGVKVPEGADAHARREALRALYAEFADARPDAASLVLAARIETDAPSAVRLLDAAVEADPRCIWAHYGRAHLALRGGDFEGARLAIEAALRLDSGHLPARRLEARLLMDGGEVGAASRALSLWIEDAVGNPTVSDLDIQYARLDLAIQLAKEGAGEGSACPGREARGAGLPARVPRARTRRGGVGSGRFEESEAAILRSLELIPEDSLALRQRALFVDRTGRPRDERIDAWRRALASLEALAEESDPVASLLPRIQARVRIAELEARPPVEPEP